MRLLAAFACLFALSALAHPGHGPEEWTDTLAHLMTAEHLIPVAALLAGVWMARRHRVRNRSVGRMRD